MHVHMHMRMRMHMHMHMRMHTCMHMHVHMHVHMHEHLHMHMHMHVHMHMHMHMHMHRNGSCVCLVGRRGGGEEREEAVDAPRLGELAQLDNVRLGERVEDARVVAGREVARAELARQQVGGRAREAEAAREEHRAAELLRRRGARALAGGFRGGAQGCRLCQTRRERLRTCPEAESLVCWKCIASGKMKASR